jgi:HEAT repeat protein
MSDAIRDLVRRLGEAAGWESACERLLARGPEVVPELTDALEGELPPRARHEVLRILAELGDPRAAPAFRRGLGADDPTERALSARGLDALGTGDAVAALVSTLHDAPDPLRRDVTPAVRALASRGVAALPEVLPLLSSADPETRRRAERVLQRVTFARVKERLDPGAPGPEADRRWRALWEENGGYAWDAPEGAREASVRRWRAWLERHAGEEGG